METPTEMSLVRLFRDAGAAHGTHEEITLKGVYDERWADWYANYLLEHGLRDLLLDAEALDAALITVVLTRLDTEYVREPPSIEWPSYYALRFVSVLDNVCFDIAFATDQPGRLAGPV